MFRSRHERNKKQKWRKKSKISFYLYEWSIKIILIEFRREIFQVRYDFIVKFIFLLLCFSGLLCVLTKANLSTCFSFHLFIFFNIQKNIFFFQISDTAVPYSIVRYKIKQTACQIFSLFLSLRDAVHIYQFN